MNIGIRLHDTRPGTLRERLGFAAAQGFSCVQLAMGKAVPGFRMVIDVCSFNGNPAIHIIIHTE